MPIFMLQKKRHLLFASIFFFINACGQTAKPVEKKSAPTIAGFSQIRDRILKEKCSRCHLNLESYSIILNYVEPGQPGNSELYNNIVNGAMPPNGMKLSDNEVKAIELWIQEGAQND